MIVEQRDGESIYVRFSEGTEWKLSAADLKARTVEVSNVKTLSVASIRDTAKVPDGLDESGFSVSFRPDGGVDLMWEAEPDAKAVTP